MVLNFRGAGYINSTGIALIVGMLAKARTRAIPIRAFGLTPHYQEIFEITRLADFLAINPDEDSAVNGAEGTTTMTNASATFDVRRQRRSRPGRHHGGRDGQLGDGPDGRLRRGR